MSMPIKHVHTRLALTAGGLIAAFGVAGCAKEDASLMDAAPPPAANARAATPAPNDLSVVAGPSLGGADASTNPPPTPPPAQVSSN